MTRQMILLALLLLLPGPGRAAFEPGALAPPEIAVPLLEPAPAAAEGIGAAGWARAARVFGFVNMGTGRPARERTEVWLGRDAQALCIALVCGLPAGTKPVAHKSGRDANVWEEDSVELYLALPGARDDKDYWQLSVGASGATWDGRGGSPAWNGEWQHWVQAKEGLWAACLRVPFTTLGLGAAPSALRFALSRTVVAPQSENTVFIRVSPTMYFTEVARMGTLRLDADLPAVALTQRGDFSEGDVTLVADAVVLPPGKIAESVVTVLDRGGKVIAADAQQPRFDSRAVVHAIKGLPNGEYRLRYTYGDPGKPVLRTVALEWPLQVQATVAIQPTVKLREQGRRLVLSLETRGRAPQGGHPEFAATLQTPEGQQIAGLGSVPYRPKGAVLEAALPDLKPLTYYQVRVVLRDGEKVLADAVTSFGAPARPEWVGFREGLQDGVPKPWTPVVLKGRSVRVWGRTYSFRQGPVPDSVVSQGIEVLASPSRLALEPAPRAWKLLSARTEGRGPTTAVFRWESVGAPILYRAETRVEFDGVIHVDVTVPAGAPAARLAFEMACPRERARYIHRGPMSWGGLHSAYELPAKPEPYAISRAVNTGAFYFLDDFRGIGWYDGMPHGWTLKRPEAGMEMIPGEKTALFRVSYIDEARAYDCDRTFTFGLQAVPVKPMPEDEPGLRTWYSYRYGDEDPKQQHAWFSTAEYAPEGNFDPKQGTAEIWVKPHFDPATLAEPERFLEISHGRWIQFRLQQEPAGKGITAISDLWGSMFGALSNVTLKRGEWTHVAVTWDDTALRLYVGGKEVGRKEGALSSHFRYFPVMVYAGGRSVSVDGLRISGKPRASFDLTAPPAADADTLLCDNFERTAWVNGRRAFVPEKASPTTEGGYWSPDMVPAEGKWGKGIGPMRVPVRSLVQGMAALGLRQLQFHSQYVDRCFAGLHVEDEGRFRAAVQAAKASGLRVLMYLSNSLSTYDPMWHAYADDWLIEPRGTPFRPDFRPDEEGYQACPRSGYWEYFLSRMARMMDDYKVDGYFLDGRTYSACANEQHGCGTTNFEGERVPKSDIWDGRRRALQFAAVIKQRGGHWMQHDSGLRDGPTCFIPDYAWDGEQLMGSTLGDKKRLEMVPLAPFRVIMNGRNFGLPTANLAYAYSPLKPLDYCTYSFVHGTTWAPTYRIDEAMALWPFWKAQDEFEAAAAGGERSEVGRRSRVAPPPASSVGLLTSFRGYWYPRPPARSVPNDLVKVSAHVRRGKALVMVASFNEEPLAGEVRLDLKALGLKRPKARDAFSGEPVALKGRDTLLVSIAPFRQAWYVLEEGG